MCVHIPPHLYLSRHNCAYLRCHNRRTNLKLLTLLSVVPVLLLLLPVCLVVTPAFAQTEETGRSYLLPSVLQREKSPEWSSTPPTTEWSSLGATPTPVATFSIHGPGMGAHGPSCLRPTVLQI